MKEDKLHNDHHNINNELLSHPISDSDEFETSSHANIIKFLIVVFSFWILLILSLLNLNSFKVWFFTKFPSLHRFQYLFNSTTVVTTLLAFVASLLFTDNFVSQFIMNQFNNRRKPLGGYSPRIPKETLDTVLQKGGLVGGLANDGNTCFMNSVIQSLSSSVTLSDFLQEQSKYHEEREFVFSKTLKKLFDRLNAKHLTKGKDYRTEPLLKTMSKGPNKSFLMGYNQEDAQEFFQLILDVLEDNAKKIAIKNEESSSALKTNTAIELKDIAKNSIFNSNQLGQLGPVYIPAKQIDPNLQDIETKYFQYKLITPFDGLSAERIGCLKCGEMGGIRYSVISGLSLNLPPDNYSALRLRDLLNEWIKPEIIEGVDCNRCGLNSVLEYQREQLEKLKETGATSKLIEMFENRINEVEVELSKPIIDDEIYKKLHTKNMTTKTSKSKQILISRPPPLLSIHINRSVFDPNTYRVRKNNARVIFPMELDLDKYVASAEDVNTDARLPFSKKKILDDYSDVEESEENSSDEEYDSDEESTESEDFEKINSEEEEEEELPSEKKIEEQYINPQLQVLTGDLIYTLRSVIVHFGTHNYGHYIAFRKYRDVWWRISDEDVEIVTEEEVINTQGVFMLFYELKSLVDDLESKKKEDEDFDPEKEVEISYQQHQKTVSSEEEEEEEDIDEQAVNATAFRFANL